MTFFDETLFTVAPELYRTVDGGARPPSATRSGRRRRGAGRPPPVPAGRRTAADGHATAARPGVPAAGARWIGGDRDGHPNVTAETTYQALRIHADHVLHGLRGGRDPADARPSRRPARPDADLPPVLARRLGADDDDLPETMRELAGRFPDEPYRQRLGAIAERLRRTRAVPDRERRRPLGGRYHDPGGAHRASSTSSQAALVADGLRARRLGRAPGLPLAGRDVRVPPRRRSRSASTARSTGPRSRRSGEASLRDRPGPRRARGRPRPRSSPRSGRSPTLQAALRRAACHRYVISFTALGPRTSSTSSSWPR